jgi:hypothetical protein
MAEELQKTTPDPAGTAIDSFDDLVADAGAGTENIGTNDVKPPRLMVCQSGSPQRKPDNPKQIAGLNELDLFNALSNEIYGRKLNFCVIAMLGHNWVLFDADLKVVERDLADDDPRCQWTTDDDGNNVKPEATMFYNYLLWLPDNSEVVVFSLKGTQIKNAVKLNGLLMLPLKMDGGKVMPNPPAWARTYAMETRMESDKQYSWGGVNISTVGITPPQTRQMISALAKTYKGKKVQIDHEDEVAESRTESTGGDGGAGNQPEGGDPEDM